MIEKDVVKIRDGLLALILAIAMLLVACGGDDDEKTESQTEDAKAAAIANDSPAVASAETSALSLAR